MARDCRGPKKNKGRDNPIETEKIMKIVQEMMVKCNNKPVEETITGRIVSKSDECKLHDKVNENHLLQNVRSLQLRVNNMNIPRKKTAYTRFKV